MSHRVKKTKPVAIIIAVILLLILLGLTLTFLLKKPQSHDYILTVYFDGKVERYTLDDIDTLPVYSGYGVFLKGNGSIDGPHTYRGVPINYFINKFNLSGNYTISIKYKGGDVELSKNDIEGYIDVYNKNGEYIGKRKMTMILAYEKDGKVMERDKLMEILFVSDEGIFFTNQYFHLVGVESLSLSKIPSLH